MDEHELQERVQHSEEMDSEYQNGCDHQRSVSGCLCIVFLLTYCVQYCTRCAVLVLKHCVSKYVQYMYIVVRVLVIVESLFIVCL